MLTNIRERQFVLNGNRHDAQALGVRLHVGPADTAEEQHRRLQYRIERDSQIQLVQHPLPRLDPSFTRTQTVDADTGNNVKGRGSLGRTLGANDGSGPASRAHRYLRFDGHRAGSSSGSCTRRCGAVD